MRILAYTTRSLVRLFLVMVCLDGMLLPRLLANTTLQKGPRLVVDKPVYDAGIVFDDVSSVTHTFVLRNGGAEDLIIEHIHTDCSCSAANSERKPIPPGGTFPLEVTFHFKGDLGKVFQTKTVLVTNDAENPKTELIIRGSRKREFDVYPPQASLGMVPLGNDKKMMLRIDTACVDRTLDVNRIQLSSRHLEVVGTKQPQPEKQFHSYRLQLHLLNTAPVGVLNATIQIPCEGSKRKKIEIPVRAEIKGPVTLSMAEVRFGILKRKGDAKAKQLRLEALKPFNIRSVATDQPWFQIIKDDGEKLSHTLSIKTIPEALPSKGRKIGGTITITTDVPSMATISLPVSAFCL